MINCARFWRPPVKLRLSESPTGKNNPITLFLPIYKPRDTRFILSIQILEKSWEKPLTLICRLSQTKLTWFWSSDEVKRFPQWWIRRPKSGRKGFGCRKDSSTGGQALLPGGRGR